MMTTSILLGLSVPGVGVATGVAVGAGVGDALPEVESETDDAVNDVAQLPLPVFTE
jgi:hypothetical protein